MNISQIARMFDGASHNFAIGKCSVQQSPNDLGKHSNKSSVRTDLTSHMEPAAIKDYFYFVDL